MVSEFKPSLKLITITVVTFSLFALVPLLMPGTTRIGIFILIIPLTYGSSFIFRYRKYVVTDTCLQVFNWGGTIKSEIEYNEITNLFLQKGSRRLGNVMQVDEDVEVLVVHLTGGEIARLDLTPIEDTDGLMTLLRAKVENVRAGYS